MRMDKRLMGLGRDGYISRSELRANMKRMDTGYAFGMKENSESALSTNK
jgi:hypothetical protein